MRNAVAAIGLCSWDRFLVLDRYPESGGYATVQHEFEQAGGTTSNTCATLGKLGVNVTLASVVGSDRHGDLLIESLQQTGCDTSLITRSGSEPTDSSVILVTSTDGQPERTIIWFKGAQPLHRDHIDVETLLDHRWLLVDVNDDRLREFLLSLPAHLSPRTQLAGAMTYLTDSDRETGFRHLLEHDVMFGNQRELIHLTNTDNLDAAIDVLQSAMAANACRVVYLTLGSGGSIAIRNDHVTKSPSFNVEVVDTTGAGDAFAGGCLWGLVEGLSDQDVLTRGNAAGALCCSAPGARAGLPTREEILDLIQNGTRLDDDTPPGP
jgi:sugar/nucleoside kinase (ribokinase family)